MKKQYKVLFLILIIIFGIYLINQNNQPKEDTLKTIKLPKITVEKLGSAKKITDKTLIVSVFANDLNTSWDFNNKEDVQTKNDCLENLRIGVDYLTKNVNNYASTSFVYDFELNPDLKYIGNFDKNLVVESGENYNYQTNYIKRNINSKKLLNKYDAKNVIYIFFFNTPYSNTVKPRTFRYSETSKINEEIINLYVKFLDKYVSPPATYAHEILHTFGAYDLYYANGGVSEEYVKYLENTESKDIMYTVTSEKTITNVFSELDAYYVGLVNSSSEQKTWNLPLSEHN